MQILIAIQNMSAMHAFGEWREMHMGSSSRKREEMEKKQGCEEKSGGEVHWGGRNKENNNES